MKRILFVDDNAHLLDGLRSRFRRQRHRWEMEFAPGGEVALAEIRRRPFDVVVCDMCMPGIDGATLLQHIKEERPETVRIVLSGHTELEATFRALPVAHQFLSKLCDAEVLENVIERACGLRDLLAEKTMRHVVGAVQQLPPAPRIYLELTEALSRREAELETIANIIKQDPAITARVLQIVNSAFFGLPQSMTGIRDAIAYLGVFMVKNIVLSVEVFQAFEGDPREFSVESLQQHCYLSARIAGRMLPDGYSAGDAFAAAMLHDIGKLILATQAPEHLAEVMHACRETGQPMHVVELERHPFCHAHVGAYLLGLWGLPYPLVEAVAHHHTPGQVKQREFGVLGGVYLANLLAHELLPPENGEGPSCRIPDDVYLNELGVADRVPEWRAMAADEAKALRGET